MTRCILRSADWLILQFIIRALAEKRPRRITWSRNAAWNRAALTRFMQPQCCWGVGNRTFLAGLPPL